MDARPRCAEGRHANLAELAKKSAGYHIAQRLAAGIGGAVFSSNRRGCPWSRRASRRYRLRGGSGPRVPINGSGAPLEQSIQSLRIHVQIKLTLSGASIKHLYIGAPSGVDLRATNCNIAKLEIDAINASAEIRLYQSNVGTLQLRPGALSHFEMKGGSLLNVNCPLLRATILLPVLCCLRRRSFSPDGGISTRGSAQPAR